VVRTEVSRLTGRSGSSRNTRVLPAVLVAVVVLLLGVVALASRAPLNGSGRGGAAGGGAAQQVAASPWALVLIGAGAMVAAIGLLSLMPWHLPRRREPEPYRTQPPFGAPWPIAIATALLPLLIGAALVVGGLQGTHQRLVPTGRGGQTSAGSEAHAPIRRAQQNPGASSFELPHWIPFAVLALVIAGGAALAVRSIPSDSARIVAGPSRMAPAISIAVDASIEDLRADPDARRAVIAAYRRMETTLADAGLPRDAVEAPREYLTRALGSLELTGGPIRSLTNLFERAKFSLHRIDPALRDEAIAALTAIRQELEVTS
jgi:hypothetical protein